MGEKKDLTRIEDLSDFLHEKDTDIDRKLEEGGSAESTQVDTPAHDSEESSFDSDSSVSDTSLEEDASELSPEIEFTSEIKPEGTVPDAQIPDQEEGTVPDALMSDLKRTTVPDIQVPDEQGIGEENSPVKHMQESAVSHPESSGDTQVETSPTQEGVMDSISQDILEPTLNEEVQEDGVFSNTEASSDDGSDHRPSTPSREILSPPEQTQVDMPLEELSKESDKEPPPPLPDFGSTAKPTSSKDKLGDIKKFAESITYNKVEMGSNPPFSIVLKSIKYLEDVEDIRIILREHGLLDKENEKEIEQGLSHGCILISQISEYAAIYLAHRFRRFDVDITMGPSEELHPTESYEHDARGLISKENMKQNQTESIDLTKVDDIKIILATTPKVEGYKILRHIDIVTEHSIIQEDELEAVEENPTHKIYQGLLEKLKALAKKRQGNAVVGVNYEFTPLSEKPDYPNRYKVTCSGNVVFIQNEQNPK